MRTINIRCNWNDLHEIRERLCASLQKCANRLHWKTLSFIITHYSSSLQFSIQATVSPSMKFEKEQKLPVLSSIQEEKEKTKLLEAKKEISDWPIQTSKPEAENQLEVVAPTIQKSEMIESKKNLLSEQIQEQEETPNAINGQQKNRCNVATQIDLKVGTELQKLSASTTVFFGPYLLIKDGTQSVKCVQVGDGNIKQIK
ncbi:unnamed protein product [Acanthocheilonema viteae]|uniref:Uncharacterized protein n=1 Tax=Acanthocheilonema viteae TaxID=6277 RepID=A0A498SCZ0_ACAVI|nr:unnamed protein product [Acanthocheilonema viteae]